MRVKLRISRQTGSQINKGALTRDTAQGACGDGDGGEGLDHQPGRPESWELDKPEGRPPPRNPRREGHPCPQTSGWERRDFCCFRPHRIWSFSTAAPRDPQDCQGQVGAVGEARGGQQAHPEHQGFPLWPGLPPVTCPPAPRAGLTSGVEAAPGQAHWVTIIHTKLKSTGQREGCGSVPPAPTSTWLTLGWEETRTSLVPAVHAGCPGT